MKEKVIHSRLIKIGNSQGVRLPKTLLEMSGIKDEIAIIIDNGQIIIRGEERKKNRIGWEKSFQEMTEENQDQILDKETISTSSWDELEWEW
jgi:antitoxin MazE